MIVVYISFSGDSPAGYKLESVHVFIRHGDRSPMHSIRGYDNPDLSCLFHSTDELNPRLASYIPTMIAYRRRENPKSSFKSWSLYPTRTFCEGAQLTGFGAHQQLVSGDYLHNKYIQKWQLFGEEFSPDQLLVKSTEYSRTYQSIIAFLFGILPRFNLTELHIERFQSTVFCSEKETGIKCYCPRAFEYKQKSDRLMGAIDRNNSNYSSLVTHLSDIFAVPRHQLPWLSAMWDILMSPGCHNLSLPCGSTGKCVTPSLIQRIGNVLKEEELSRINPQTDFHFYKYAHIAMFPVLLEVAKRMENTTKQRTPIKLAVYSGHDITLTPLAAVLGINMGEWPPYASRIVFELYSKAVSSGRRHFIRILYNGKDVTSKVIFCRDRTINGMCHLKYFIDFVSEDILRFLGVSKYSEACLP